MSENPYKSRPWIIAKRSSTYKDTIIKPAASNWNNISSKVKLTESTSNSTDITVYLEDSAVDGKFGEIKPYYFATPEYSYYFDSCACNTWSYAYVYGYKNQMAAYKFTTQDIISNFTHEFGHTLSLAHTNNVSASSVMKSGQQSIGPQTVDKDHLKLKWGQ